MPRFRFGKSQQVAELPAHIEIVQDSGSVLTLSGRILPNRQTIWVILRKVQNEVEQWGLEGNEMTASARHEVRHTVRWAARLLYSLGYEYEDIVSELGSLAELAELEAPKASPLTGQTEAAEHGL